VPFEIQVFVEKRCKYKKLRETGDSCSPINVVGFSFLLRLSDGDAVMKNKKNNSGCLLLVSGC